MPFSLSSDERGNDNVAMINWARITAFRSTFSETTSMLLEQSRSYIRIFVTYATLFVASMGLGYAGYMSAMIAFVAISLPVYTAFLLVSQVRSGIALDSWMIARYPRGTWQFNATIAWNGFALILMMSLSIALLCTR